METGDAKLVSIRTMDIAVAIALLVAAGIVIIDSVRLGVGWREAEGPTSGYFPFYIGVLLALASLVNLDQVPATGAVLIAAPLKFVKGTGSPLRVLALVPNS